MKSMLFILLLLTAVILRLQAQSETLINIVTATDSLLQDTSRIKEAPESLQKILGDIVGEHKQVTRDAELELDGLLFDETKTKSGKDFYDFFYSAWEAPPGAANYSIFITEMPFRLNTTQIEVKINDIIVFQSFLQPRADIVEELAQYAVAQTRMYLANYEELMRQMSDEDQAGTGIY